MGLTLGNLLGLWGLLGIPAILVIHFIHRRFRKVEVSTLFLLEQSLPKEVDGRQFRWIRNSLQLWLQLLAVLLLTLLLCDPHRQTVNPVQRAVLIVDSSFSMLASKQRMMSQLPRLLSSIGRAAARTEWLVYETNLQRGRLYRGWSADEARNALDSWSPTLGEHDVQRSIRELKEGIGSTSSYYYLTDHMQGVSGDVSVVSYGQELDNWGLAGFRIEDSSPLRFKAVLKNYSKNKGQRTWWIEKDGVRLTEGQATLDAGNFTTLTGEFPDGVDEVSLRIQEDDFKMDDVLPLRRPSVRKLKVYAERGEFSLPFRRILQSLNGAERVNAPEDAELRIVSSIDSEAEVSRGNTVLFFAAKAGSRSQHYGAVTPERSTLLDGLRWDGLTVRQLGDIKPTLEDETLLWLDSVPLIFLRKVNSRPVLVVNFDVREGNALQDPSLILLLHRFVEQIRSGAKGSVTANFELGEILPKISPVGAKMTVRPLVGAVRQTSLADLDEARGGLRAPTEPAFFEIQRDEELLLAGAVSFADARESDFRGFAPSVKLTEPKASALSDDASTELSFPIWMLFLVAVVLATWGHEKLHIRSLWKTAFGGRSA